MRKSILALLTVLFVLLMAAGGCKGEKPGPQQGDANTPGAEKARSESQQDSLEIVSIMPQTPTVLPLGERLRVKIRYHLASAEKARIWARPYTKGRRTSSYKAHGSPLHDAGNGEIEGYFYFEKQTKVDEVRVRMVSPDSKEPIATASMVIDAEWK